MIHKHIACYGYARSGGFVRLQGGDWTSAFDGGAVKAKRPKARPTRKPAASAFRHTSYDTRVETQLIMLQDRFRKH